MASDTEPAKLILPYLQRADELQKHEPLVAYYCRLYSMERGLRIPQSDRTKTTNSLLVSLMKQLEKDKASLKLGPDDNLHVEGFALNVFAKADKQDRAGRADLNTAKTFYAASIFFEILNQFGPLQPDLEQKQKYAAWKAADIRKAVKEGRKPVPGPPGGDEDLPLPSNTSSGEYDLERSRSDFGTGHDLERSISDFATSADHMSRGDPSTGTQPDSYSSPQFYDQDAFQHPTTPSPSSGFTPPPHYPSESYSTDNLHQPSSMNSSDHSVYHQPYHHQNYMPEPQQHLPPQYPSHDVPPHPYPNFQSYPSFSESSLPVAPPSHYPSYYQGSDASYPNSAPSNTAAYPSTPQHSSSSRNGSVSEVPPSSSKNYEYDSSYKPPPETIAEAHKAARFAVGALAFDEVSEAIDYLKKSLEFLTNPSAGH